MANRIGAKALHMGDITGSLEVGKRADLILIDIHPLHNSPKFSRDPNSVYAQIVFASKSTDVTDLMVNGKFLMRDRKLLTLDEKTLLEGAAEYAKKIDKFLIQREKSLLSKLIAVGGAMEEESFEVQLKVRINDMDAAIKRLASPKITSIRKRHYREYDTYFIFDGDEDQRLRYREDDLINEMGMVENVRSRLTMIGPAREGQFENDIMLSRSRYFAPALQSLRFYREYFKPNREIEVIKERHRYLIEYQGAEFFLNFDAVITPALGQFLEIKSRTWSRQDAENKSKLVQKLLKLLIDQPCEYVNEDYYDLVLSAGH